MRLVISQPMFFPWVGLLEPICLADTWVFYDDVQFSKGSFTNRVQYKTAQGTRWLTLPLARRSLGDRIDAIRVDDRVDFREEHLAKLEQAYRGAPYRSEMLQVVSALYEDCDNSLCDLAVRSQCALAAYFDLPQPRWLRSSELAIGGSGSRRVLDHCLRLSATSYVTGHGARNYLDHEAFERAGIEVRYMDYERRPYRQLHGAFTPYLSALDLIANEGPEGRRFIGGSSRAWREAVAA